MKSFPSNRGDIYLGSCRQGFNNLLKSFHPSDILWVADTNTARLCLPVLDELTTTGTIVTIPAGEAYKSLESCQYIWRQLIDMKADRNAIVINVGGGMICDLGGFAAACYQRGIRFGHMPTSLLAMADAAIGGKTGVDFQGFKNYLGRIEVPAFIWIDPIFLQTLPSAEVRNGLTEIVKHAIIDSLPLWNILENADTEGAIHWDTLLEENLQIKQRIAEEDPFEMGRRKILNFGHTIGHALESYFLNTGKPLAHGEAVALGMMAESHMALEMGILPAEEFKLIIALIHRLLRPSEVPLPPMEMLDPWLAGDKKNKQGQNRYSLPETIGTCRWNISVDKPVVIRALDWLTAHGRPADIRLNTL